MDGETKPDGYLPLKLRVPEPATRPGDAPTFDHLDFDAPGRVPRPAPDCTVDETKPHGRALIRVLDDEGHAQGPWADAMTPDEGIAALRAMVRTRAFDARMMRAQRQGSKRRAVQP